MDKKISLSLINSRPFKKAEPYLVIAFFLSYFSVLFVSLPWFWGIIMGIPSLFLPSLMADFSRSLTPIGQLILNYKEVIITMNGASGQIYPIPDLKDFRIIRNATYHQTGNRFPPDSHNNWISFTYNQKEIKQEFGITSKEENDHFEIVINELRSMYTNFYYASI